MAGVGLAPRRSMAAEVAGLDRSHRHGFGSGCLSAVAAPSRRQRSYGPMARVLTNAGPKAFSPCQRVSRARRGNPHPSRDLPRRGRSGKDAQTSCELQAIGAAARTSGRMMRAGIIICRLPEGGEVARAGADRAGKARWPRLARFECTVGSATAPTTGALSLAIISASVSPVGPVCRSS
jgi:hypothetical protein